MAPIVRHGLDGERELVMARWGMPGPPQFGGRPVTNNRNLRSPHWQRWRHRSANTPTRSPARRMVAGGSTIQPLGTKLMSRFLHDNIGRPATGGWRRGQLTACRHVHRITALGIERQRSNESLAYLPRIEVLRLTETRPKTARKLEIAPKKRNRNSFDREVERSHRNRTAPALVLMYAAHRPYESTSPPNATSRPG